MICQCHDPTLKWAPGGRPRRAGGVEEGPQIDLGDLAQPLAGGAHPRRHVEREGVGVPHVGRRRGEEQAQEGDAGAGAHRGAGPAAEGRWSTMTTAERCSITSTAGRPYFGGKARTKAGRVSLYCRLASAAMVSKTSDDFQAGDSGDHGRGGAWDLDVDPGEVVLTGPEDLIRSLITKLYHGKCLLDSPPSE